MEPGVRARGLRPEHTESGFHTKWESVHPAEPQRRCHRLTHSWVWGWEVGGQESTRQNFSPRSPIPPVPIELRHSPSSPTADPASQRHERKWPRQCLTSGKYAACGSSLPTYPKWFVPLSPGRNCYQKTPTWRYYQQCKILQDRRGPGIPSHTSRTRELLEDVLPENGGISTENRSQWRPWRVAPSRNSAVYQGHWLFVTQRVTLSNGSLCFVFFWCLQQKIQFSKYLWAIV